jgi:CheY-like chemotaxis protein
VWWSSTAAASGWNDLLPEQDPPSVSPYPPEPNSREGESKSEGAKQAPQRTILLVEDNPTDIFVITEVIEACSLGVRLEIARNGQEALTYLEELAGVPELPCPALVLLDLNLPKVNGLEVLRQLRNNPRCSRTPVIVVSSSTAEADRNAVQHLGVEAYFQKPRTLAAYAELGKLVKSHLPPEGDDLVS